MEPCIKCAGLAAQLEIAQHMNDHYASDLRRLQEESKKDNGEIGSYKYKLSNALHELEKADKMLRRAIAEIAMLNARIEHGSGADKLVLCDLAFIACEAQKNGWVMFTDKHLAELRKAAKG